MPLRTEHSDEDASAKPPLTGDAIETASVGDDEEAGEMDTLEPKPVGRAVLIGKAITSGVGAPVTLTRLGTVRALCLPVYLNCALLFLVRSYVITALPLYILELDGTAQDVGNTAAIYGFGYFIANIPIGCLMTIVGPSGVLLVTCALFGLSVALSLLTRVVGTGWGLVVLAAGSFCLGAGTSAGILAFQSFIACGVTSARRGLAMSTLGGFARFGYTLGPLIAGLITEEFGAASMFILQAATTVLLIVCVVAFLPPMPSGTRGLNGGALNCADAHVVVIAGWRPLLRVIVFLLALQVVRRARELFFALEGRQVGLSEEGIGTLASLSFFFDLICFPLAGGIMDTCGRRWAGFASITIQSIGLLLLTWSTLPLAVVSAIVTGIGNGLSSGIILTIGADLAPAGPSQGLFLSFYRSLVNSAELVAPFAVGSLAHVAGVHAAELVTSILGFVGALWVVVCVPETLGERTRHAVPQKGCACWRVGTLLREEPITPTSLSAAPIPVGRICLKV